MRALALLLGGLLVAAACHATRPPEGPGTEWPCGYQWFVCPVQSPGRPLVCCPLGHICGGPDPAGFQRCEPGFCCYDGDDYGAAADGGAHEPVPQRVVP